MAKFRVFTEITEQELLDMKLHDRFYDAHSSITRVISGWLYVRKSVTSDTVTETFVPYPR